MLFREASSHAAACRIKAIAFRADRSALLVTITDLSFDGCKLRSGAALQIGEGLRLHVPGQGWIRAEVERTNGGEASVVFTTECHV